MAKSKETYSKKEREKKRQKKKKEKEMRKAQKKLEGKTGEEFMYVDADGNLTPTPPDPSLKIQVNAEDILVSTPKQGAIDPADLIRSGVVKFFNEEKGYGFIVDSETKESLFVHANSLEAPIRDNDKVSFEVGSGPKGPVAIMVRLV